MGDGSFKPSIRSFLQASTGFMVMMSCVFAWVFVVYLSSALYQGNSSVLSATLFAAASSVAAFLVCSLLLVVFRLDLLMRIHLWMAVAGLAALAVASMLSGVTGLAGLPGAFAPVFIGSISGAGLSLVALFCFTYLTRFVFSQVIVCYIVSLGMGVLIFCLYMLLVPQTMMSVLIVAFPLVALLSLGVGTWAVRMKRFATNVYARSLARSQMRGMYEHRAFFAFAIVSGFLFGYCYNVYPKSTRLVGAYTEALFGAASPAAVIFLVSCLSVVIMLVVVGKFAKHNSAYAFGSLLLVGLAILYFNLPNMPNNWMLFVLLDSAAVSTMLFVVVGVILKASAADGLGMVKTVLLTVAGVSAGALLAVIYIETTVPDPIFVMDEALRDFIFVSTPAVGFIVLALLFFVLARTMFFPDPAHSLNPIENRVDMLSAANTLSERYGLTPREEEILGMLLQGRSGPYISEDLYLSKSTVKTHIRHIYDKTGVSSRQQLIDLAQGANVEHSDSA